MMLKWMKHVKDSNYVGAQNFLRLYYNDKQAEEYVNKLRHADITQHRPNDILRAARLDPGPVHDPGVRRRLVKCVMGEEISPVLMISLVQGVLIVDGFHRVSMCYYLDPFMSIPAKLI